MGQVEYTDPWGGYHKVTIEPPPVDPGIKPFNTPYSEESLARDRREELYRRKIEAKRQECEFLDRNAEDHKDYYQNLEDPEDEDYQAASNAVNEYNNCLDTIDALAAEMNTAPVDFGTTEDSGYQWPAEVPEPTGRPFDPGETPYVHHPEDYPPVASTYEWPEEVPKPGDWPPEEPPELIEQPPPTPPVTPPTTASVDDWKTRGCPQGTQRMVRGGMCVSSGLVSSGLTMPTTTQVNLSGRIPLSRGLGVRALGLF